MSREVLMTAAPEAHVQFQVNRVAAALGAAAKFEAQLMLAIAQYSAGAPLETVRQSIKAAVTALAQDAAPEPLPLHQPEHYYPALWALSMSMLFGDATPVFAQRLAGQDLLVDRLLQLTDKSIIPTEKLLYPAAYKHLITAMDAPKAAAAHVEAYFAAWYQAMGPTPWHDTHLQQDPAFFGYWAFELAAVVKALNISDGPFSKNAYYPRELVHQRTYQVWLDDGKAKIDARAEALKEAQGRLGVVKDLLSDFFGGNPTTEQGEKSLNESLKFFGKLMATTDQELESDPELVRQGFLEILRSVSTLAGDTAQLVGQPSADSPQIAALREIEKELLEANPELAELDAQLKADTGFDPQSPEAQKLVSEAQGRLTSVHQALEELIQSQTLEMEQLFTGMDQLVERLQGTLGLQPEKPLDIYAEVSERVGKSLAEANKKNMIQADFDWSSLWRKD